MSCKIKGAVLFDQTLMQSFATVMDEIRLPYKQAFKLYQMGNEMGLAFQNLEEKRIAILEKHAVKNSKGGFKKGNNNEYIFKDKNAVSDEVAAMLSEDIELNCDLLELSDLEEGILPPALIQQIAMLQPITKKD